LKQLFHIEFEAAGDKQQVLSLRIGKQHFAFAIANKSGLELYQLAYYSIEEWNEKCWQEILESNPAISNSFYEVLVAFDFSESLLAPSKEFKTDEAGTLLNITYGVNSQSTVISESITGWQLYNIYAVPAEIKDWVSRKFPTARFWHQYSLDVRNSIGVTEEGRLQVDFRKEEFVVIATNRNNILLTQTFEYTTPEDVLFYLLKICNQFSLSRERVELQLSGLVDKQSSLYKELYQYFINIKFRNAQWNTGVEYPAHFFTSLNDLAKCVS